MIIINIHILLQKNNIENLIILGTFSQKHLTSPDTISTKFMYHLTNDYVQLDAFTYYQLVPISFLV